jgi:mycofactocin system glycosyltransferase
VTGRPRSAGERVVATGRQRGVEAAQLGQHGPAHGQVRGRGEAVAAHVLLLVEVERTVVRGPPRREQARGRRARQHRPGHQVVAAPHAGQQRRRPAGHGPAVGVGEGDDVTDRRAPARVARRVRPGSVLDDDPDAERVRACDLGRRIGAAVVDDDDLGRRHVLPVQRVEQPRERGCAVADGDHHADRQGLHHAQECSTPSPGDPPYPSRMPSRPLPPELRLRLTTTALDGAGLLLGGTPLRLLRTDPAALADLTGGAPAARHPELARTLLAAGLAEPASVGSAWRLSDVTAVIPVKDDARRLPGALRAVAGVAEVVVVDDGSVDGTGDVARRAGARVLRHESPRGPAAARNAGLAAARTPLVVLLDADARAEPGWLEALLPALADPAVLLAAPRVLGLQDSGGSLLERYERVQGVLDRGPVAALVGPDRPVGFVAAAALLVRREALLELGGFDEALRLGEDVDLCARAAQAAWLLRYEPAALVRHDHRTSWRPFLRRRYEYGTADADLARRHPRLQPPVSVGGWLAAALLLARAPSPPAAAAAVALAGAGAVRTTRLLHRGGVPVAVAARTAAGQEVTAARRCLGSTVRRPWLPVLAALAVPSPRARCCSPQAPRRCTCATTGGCDRSSDPSRSSACACSRRPRSRPAPGRAACGPATGRCCDPTWRCSPALTPGPRC